MSALSGTASCIGWVSGCNCRWRCKTIEILIQKNRFKQRSGFFIIVFRRKAVRYEPQATAVELAQLGEGGRGQANVINLTSSQAS